jgi:hypothetical protein
MKRLYNSSPKKALNILCPQNQSQGEPDIGMVFMPPIPVLTCGNFCGPVIFVAVTADSSFAPPLLPHFRLSTALRAIEAALQTSVRIWKLFLL